MNNTDLNVNIVNNKKRKVVEASSKESEEQQEIKRLKAALEAANKRNFALEEENNKLQSQLQVSKAESLSKRDIYINLEAIGEIDKKVLVDIDLDIDKCNLVGRPKVVGSSAKQMRHIIPYSFVEKYIETLVKRAEGSGDKLLASLKSAITDFSIYRPGFCFEKEELEISPLRHNQKIKTLDKKEFVHEGKHYALFPPSAKNDIFGAGTTPTKPNLAKQKHEAINRVITEHNIQKLISSINDDNTKTICAEAIARLMLTLYNGSEYCSFPDEGNTINEEIRLYKSALDAKKKTSNYEVVTAFDIASKKPVDLNGKIRLVNNEGPKIKQSLEALSTIDDIIVAVNTCQNVRPILNTYNTKYNINLKLSNGKSLPEKYTKKIDSTDDLNSIASSHIAKHLYSVFDLKPLEKKVLSSGADSEKKAIKLYPALTVPYTAKYSFKIGSDYRSESIKNAKGYNKTVKFRGEEIDHTLLAKKAVEIVSLVSKTYEGLATGVIEDTKSNYKKKFFEDISKAFCSIISLDYGFKGHDGFQNVFENELINNFKNSSFFEVANSTPILIGADKKDLISDQE